MEKDKQQNINEAEIRQIIDNHVQAIQTMNLESTISIYAQEIVSFDLVTLLWYHGLGAKRNAWIDAFATYQPPMGYEIHNLNITLNDNLAFGHSLNRVSGTLKNGHNSDFWLRWTMCFQKIDSKWLITHEQVSVPVDLKSGKAIFDLKP